MRIFVVVFSLECLRTQSAVLRAHYQTNAHYAQLGPERFEPKQLNITGKLTDSRSTAKCFADFPGSRLENTKCPTDCPYLRYDPQLLCHFICITADHCQNETTGPPSFADKETGWCSVCRVPGCQQCDDSPRRCGTCKAGFQLTEGRCLPQNRWYWRFAYIFLGLLVCFVLAYIVLLANREIKSPRELQFALAYRNFSILRKEGRHHNPYPIDTDLCNECVSGPGLLLHFRFEHALLLWSLCVFALLAAIALYHHTFKATDVIALAPQHDQAYEACADLSERHVDEAETMRIHYLKATGLIYIGSTAMALIFAHLQRRKFIEEVNEIDTVSDYALLASGFPPESGDADLEAEYTKFFRTAFGDCIIGVSICWDYLNQGIDIETHIGDALHHQDNQYLQRKSSAPVLFELKKARSSRRCLDPKMRCIDEIFWGTACGTEAEEEDDKTMETNTLNSIKQLKGTGHVFVIFRTESDRNSKLEGPPLPKYKDQEITLRNLECSARTVLWDGFSLSKDDRVRHIIKGVLMLVLGMLVWALCFYAPYAHYILSYSQVAGMSGGDAMESFLLGLLITVGNQLIYAMCQKIAETATFYSTDDRDTFNVILYTVAVTVNTLVDLWLVVHTAYGFQQDSNVDTKSLVRNPSLQHSLFVELVEYLYPGTLLIPFMLEPVFITLVPYHLGRWLVRSREGVRLYQAEQMMVCPQFDLCRYGDILVNVMLVLLCFFLTSISLWWVFLMLALSIGVISLWDHTRLLRFCQRSEFDSMRMDVVGQYMLAVPCALLAGAFVFKLYGGQALVKSWEQNSFLVLHAVWSTAFIAFLVHLIVHCTLLRYLIPKFLPEHIPAAQDYELTASQTACNWFNSNPIHCLRSSFYFKHKPPHTFYIPGKEYLQKKNIAINSFYEADEDYHEGRESLMQAFTRLVTHRDSLSGKPTDAETKAEDSADDDALDTKRRKSFS